MNMVSALFVDPDGPYASIHDVDCWDESRDARKYRGPHPVVAHPPCNRWGKLAPVNHARWGTPIGKDGGCFKSALYSVIRYGGVLEHPKDTIAWKTFGLKKPDGNTWNRVSDRCWVGEVWQSDYGHLANKRTWLYYVGYNEPEQFVNTRKKGTHQVGGGVNTGFNQKPRLNQKVTHLTPKLFAEYLVRLARGAM